MTNGGASVCVPLSKLRAYMARKPPEVTTRGGFLVYLIDKNDKQEHNGSMDTTLTILVPIIVALIGASASIAGSFLSLKKSEHERDIKDAQREQRQCDRLERIDEKIERLEKKVDEHNGYAEKFAKNSESLAVMATKIEHIEKRIA